MAYEWLRNKRSSIKESTYYNYMYVIDKYLNSKFGNEDIKSIINFNEFACELLKTLASKTVRDIISVLKAILEFYESEYGDKLNYKKINIPKLEKKQLKIITTKEKLKLEKYCLNENSLKSLGIIVCLYTGLRIGEICALKWENIDLNEKNIYIQKTLQRVYDKENKVTSILIGTPKTENSIRIIPINKKIYNLLKNIRKKYKKNDFFLTGKSNKFVEPRNYQYTFEKILKRAQLPQYNFHILRHTFATNCIEVGMDIKTLSEILGHASVEITLDKYVHSSTKLKRKYLEKL